MDITLEMETEAFRRWSFALIRDMKTRGAKQTLRLLAFEFLNRVIAKTPVDEGRARGGWASYLIKNGKPFVPGRNTKRGRGGRSVKQSGQTGVDEGSFEENFTGGDLFILLINAVPYIVLLEFGSSDQAPAGMMRITFREMRAGGSRRKALREAFVKSVARTNRERRGARPRWEAVPAQAFG